MSMREVFLGEFLQEAAATRKMLEAVPEDKLGWKPHEKSMTLGRLAGHIAENPQWACVSQSLCWSAREIRHVPAPQSRRQPHPSPQGESQPSPPPSPPLDAHLPR